MMDYEVFKEIVKNKFLSYMPKEYQDMEIRINPIDKVNRKMDGLSICKKGAGKYVSPGISIGDMYKDYIRKGDFQAAMRKAAETMDQAFRRAEVPVMDKSTAKDNIIFQFINTVQNEEMLKNLPHREFQDLSIIYRWVLEVEEKGISSTEVTNRLAEELGMGEEQLFQAATENTRRILPPVTKDMKEILGEMLSDNGMPPSVIEPMVEELPMAGTMWVMTNEYGIGGAVSMFYEDRLHELAESMGSDLYILPASVHEVIAVSTEIGEPEELAEMVAEINMSEVELCDRLSNQVYHYDKDLRKLTLATDTPNKRLDGIAAGQEAVYETKQSR